MRRVTEKTRKKEIGLGEESKVQSSEGMGESRNEEPGGSLSEGSRRPIRGKEGSTG